MAGSPIINPGFANPEESVFLSPISSPGTRSPVNPDHGVSPRITQLFLVNEEILRQAYLKEHIPDWIKKIPPKLLLRYCRHDFHITLDHFDPSYRCSKKYLPRMPAKKSIRSSPADSIQEGDQENSQQAAPTYYAVEEIQGFRINKAGFQYIIKWENYSILDNTRISPEQIPGLGNMARKFWDQFFTALVNCTVPIDESYNFARPRVKQDGMDDFGQREFAEVLNQAGYRSPVQSRPNIRALVRRHRNNWCSESEPEVEDDPEEHAAEEVVHDSDSEAEAADIVNDPDYIPGDNCVVQKPTRKTLMYSTLFSRTMRTKKETKTKKNKAAKKTVRSCKRTKPLPEQLPVSEADDSTKSEANAIALDASMDFHLDDFQENDESCKISASPEAVESAPETGVETCNILENKQYKCTFRNCGKIFGNRRDTNIHISCTHATEVCPKCGKIYRKKIFNVHLAKCGSADSRLVYGKHCKDCDLTFLTSALKRNHIWNDMAHGTLCVCCQQLVKKRNLKTHRCGI